MDMTHSFTPALSETAAAKFEAANHAYVAADKAMNDFHDQHLIPASKQWEAWRDEWPHEPSNADPEYLASRAAASAIFDPVQGQFDRLASESMIALMALISTPAPDMSAITRKVQVLIYAQEWDGGDCESHLKHILADLQQVSGSHPPAAPDATSNWPGEEIRQTLADIERPLVPPALPRDDTFWALVDELEAVEAQPYDPDSDDEDINRASELLGAIMTLPVRDPTAIKWKLDYMMPEAAWVPEYIEQIKADYTLWLGAPAAHNADAPLHNAWKRWLAAREASAALPEDCADREKKVAVYFDDASAAEGDILDAKATTPEGVAIKLRAALANLLAFSFAQEEALRRNDLAFLATADLEWGPKLVLSALRDLDGMPRVRASGATDERPLQDAAARPGELTGMMVEYLAQHNAVLSLAEARQVFDVTFRQRQAAGVAHTKWEDAHDHSYDSDHPVERAWGDALRAHEAAWKLLAGSAVETMGELQEKIDLCRTDPDIECEGFRDLLFTCIQSDMRHLTERKAA